MGGKKSLFLLTQQNITYRTPTYLPAAYRIQSGQFGFRRRSGCVKTLRSLPPRSRAAVFPRRLQSRSASSSGRRGGCAAACTRTGLACCRSRRYCTGRRSFAHIDRKLKQDGMLNTLLKKSGLTLTHFREILTGLWETF